MIESEFAMTNEPTKSAIPPNASRNALRKEMNSSVSAASDAACSLPDSDLRVRRKDLLDLGDQLVIRHVRLRGHRDLVESADLLEQPLRRGQVEAGERGAADRQAGAELDDARDPQAPDRPFGLHADRLADREVLLRRSLLVDDDLVRPRPPALEQRERVEDRVAVRYREAEVRRAAEDDGLPVVPYQLRRVGVDAALRLGDIRQGAHLFDQRLVEEWCSDALCLGEIERGLPGDDGGRALPDVGEDLVERLVDRVGQDERPADHRDTEDDRDRGESGPQLSAQQPPNREAGHAEKRTGRETSRRGRTAVRPVGSDPEAERVRPVGSDPEAEGGQTLRV